MPTDAPLPLIDGRFRLLRLLAVGGMGELYLATARDLEIEGLEQLVVIKRILPEFAKNRDVVTMFLIEARIAARLDHANVVQVYDMGQTNGSLYFTMEYLHGADLGRLFDAARARKSLPLGIVVSIIVGVCAGLHFAHEMRRLDGRPMGIVHRDVSPGNVFITFDGAVKLVDFGISKVLSSSQRTEAGMLKGKLAYMSPEQVRGEPIDRRSDIFAIGILLYELVTRTHLFEDGNEYDIMTQIANGEIPAPSTRRPEILPELEQIILTALAVDRDDRYATAQELAEALADFAQGSNIRYSTAALKQYMHKLIGDTDYPWYLDEEGPEEAAAVRKWFASAVPEAEVEEIEILDIGLDDMFGDQASEQADEEQYDEQEYYEEDEEVTRIAATPRGPQLQPRPLQMAPPRRRRLSTWEIVGFAGFAFAALVLLWRCNTKPTPSKPPPPVVQAEPEPEPPKPPPVVKKVEPPPVVTPPPEPEPVKKAGKQRAKKAARDAR